MNAIVITIVVIVFVGLLLLQSYFTIGPGRHLTIGNESHWWNHPISRNGRRILGGVLAIVMIFFFVYDLLNPRAPSIFGAAPVKDVFDALFAVFSVLVAFGVLPRPRRTDASN